jgi:hypothetical protein
MITLGIGKLIVRQRQEPSQALQSLSPLFQQALSEVVAWCSAQEFSATQFRSRELDPLAVLTIPSFDELGIEAWLNATRESYKRAISAIKQTRLTLLRHGNIPIPDLSVLQSTGRLLLYEPLETVTDGASEASSRGYFDIRDAPPWDTWFLYWEGAIVSWVPESLIGCAQSGIDANPVDCIRWIDWSELPRGL